MQPAITAKRDAIVGQGLTTENERTSRIEQTKKVKHGMIYSKK